MPNRIVRESINTSERVEALGDWGAEVFYRRLINSVDDFGFADARPAILRADMYALALDRVSTDDIERWLSMCADASVGLIELYEHDGKPYLHLLRFGQQVRAKRSKCPHPLGMCASNAQHVRSMCAACDEQLRANAPVSESESECASEPASESDAGGADASLVERIAGKGKLAADAADLIAHWAEAVADPKVRSIPAIVRKRVADGTVPTLKSDMVVAAIKAGIVRSITLNGTSFPAPLGKPTKNTKGLYLDGVLAVPTDRLREAVYE